MNYYTLVTADDCLPCSKEDGQKLQELWDEWNKTIEESDGAEESHGLTLEIASTKKGAELFIYSEENGRLCLLPDEVLELLGDLIKKADREHWEFGVAYYADRACPGAYGGTAWRIDAGTGYLHERETSW